MSIFKIRIPFQLYIDKLNGKPEKLFNKILKLHHDKQLEKFVILTMQDETNILISPKA